MGTDGLYGMTVHRPRQTDVNIGLDAKHALAEGGRNGIVPEALTLS
jgi:hypothetical protein